MAAEDNSDDNTTLLDKQVSFGAGVKQHDAEDEELPSETKKTALRHYQSWIEQNDDIPVEEKISEKMQQEFKTLFVQFDLDKSGTISIDELKQCFKGMHINVGELDLTNLFEMLDEDGDNELDWDEFLTVMAGDKHVLEEHDLREAFEEIDVDGDDAIGVDELHEYMLKLGETITREQAEEMVAMADRDGTGYLSSDEFTRILLGADDEEIFSSALNTERGEANIMH